MSRTKWWWYYCFKKHAEESGPLLVKIAGKALFSSIVLLFFLSHTGALRTSVKASFHFECFYIKFSFYEAATFYFRSISHNMGLFLLIARL